MNDENEGLATGDLIEWREPIWAAHTKPRGKPDRIGEQIVTGEIIESADPVSIRIETVEAVTGLAAPGAVKAGDMVRRKMSSLTLGQWKRLEKGRA